MPHDGYMEVKKICEKHEAHLICDEEICGFGRTGQRFDFINYGVYYDGQRFNRPISAAFGNG